MVRNVLISGAGVAGLALAYWLGKAGFHVTLVETQPAFRRGGQAVDIRGVALDVVRAMGLLDKARALRTRLKGMSLLDAQGVEVGRTLERTFSAGRLDSPDIEIFRDDLCELLMGALADHTEIVYGDSIQGLTEAQDHVAVTLASARQRTFDLVIGADGIYSATRKLWFDEEANVVKSLDVVLALFTTPNLIGLSDWQVMHRVEGLGVVIYPSRDQTELRVSAGFGSGGIAMPRGDIDAQKATIRSHCAHLGGDFATVFHALDETSSLYYNELAQIRMPRWSRGRVGLVGDAAHCASPFSGQGTSLALVGAFVLGSELAKHPGQPSLAFDHYERRMRPFVLMNQDMVDVTRLGPVPDEVMARSKNGIELSDLLESVAQ